MPTVKEESEFGLAIARSVAEFQPCKDALAKAAQKLDSIIVKPILNKLESGQSFSPIEKKTIEFLVKQHSADGRQWGASMRQQLQWTIEEEIDKKAELFKNISLQLSSEKINNIKNEHELAGTMKAITDCCYCYVEYFKSEESALSSDYKTLKTKVTPTPAELAMRITYTEVGGVHHVATAYGIGQEDVKPMKEDQSLHSERYDQSGKSQFVQTDLLARIGFVILRYNFADANYKKAQELEGNQENINNLKKELDEYQKLMNSLGVPLDFHERASRLGPLFEHTAVWAASYTFYLGAGDVYKIHPNAAAPVPLTARIAALDTIPNIPAIQEIASFHAKLGELLPLIASASGTTARTLIALQDMGVFTKQGDFDVEIAQYITITLCGTLVHGGHHSVLEIGAIYNRLLEHHAKKTRVCSERTNVPNSTAANGYSEYIYKAGDYNSFVPKNMRNVDKLPVNIFLKTQLSGIRASTFLASGHTRRTAEVYSPAFFAKPTMASVSSSSVVSDHLPPLSPSPPPAPKSPPSPKNL